MLIALRIFNRAGLLVGPIPVSAVVRTDAEWRAQLTAEQYRITRSHGTEAPFCGTLLDNKQEGVYSCLCCGLPLFASSDKFDSGTGWPSFVRPIAVENVKTVTDTSYGMTRFEIRCARCQAHLGHVFPDGPAPTRERHCLNSESLNFTEATALATLADPTAG